MKYLNKIAILLGILVILGTGCKKPKVQDKVEVQLIDSAQVVPLDTAGTDVMKIND